MPSKPEIIAHRGWSSRFPDNTLAGLGAAATVADRVEVDIRRSGDGKLALSHDPSVSGLELAATPWAILAEVDLGDNHHPALLDEALAFLPSIPFLLEVKNEPYGPGFEPDHRLGLEVAERARPGDLIASFNWATMDRILELYPNAATGLVTVADTVGEARDWCRRGHRALIAEQRSEHEAIVDALESGLEVHMWTVNDSVRAEELAAIGVSGIITDHPDMILRSLGERR